MGKIWLLYRVGVETDKPPIKLREGLNKLGRSIENKTTILISSKWVSRSHCEITVSDGFVCIKDLGGMNGTFVNNIRLDKERLTELKCGDIISLGKEYIEPIEMDHFVYRIMTTDINGFFAKETVPAPKRRSSSSPSRESGSPVVKRIRGTSPFTLPHQVTSSVQSPTAIVDLTDDEPPSLPIVKESSDKYLKRTDMIDLTKSDESTNSMLNTNIRSDILNTSNMNNNNNSRKVELLELINTMKEDELAFIKNVLCERTVGNINETSLNANEDVSFKKPSIPKKSPLQTRIGEILNPIVSSTMEERNKSIDLGMNNEISSSQDDASNNQVNEIDSYSSGTNIIISSVLSLKNNVNECTDVHKVEAKQNYIDINSKSLESGNVLVNDENKIKDINPEHSFGETVSEISSLQLGSEQSFSNKSDTSNDEEIQKLRKKRYGGNEIHLNLKRVEDSPKQKKKLKISSVENDLSIKEQSHPQKTVPCQLKERVAVQSLRRKSVEQVSSKRRPKEEYLNDNRKESLRALDNTPSSYCLSSIENVSLKSLSDSSKVENVEGSLSQVNLGENTLHSDKNVDIQSDNEMFFGFEQQEPVKYEYSKTQRLQSVSNNDPDVERIFNDLVSEGSPIPIETSGKSKCKIVHPNENIKIQETTDYEYSYNINDIEEHIRRTSIEDVDETGQNSTGSRDKENALSNVPSVYDDATLNEDVINNSFSQDGAIEVDDGDKTFSSLFLENFEEIIDVDGEVGNADENELLVSIIKEEVDEMHEEADIDLFEAHFSQFSQENIVKESDAIPNLDIVEEPLEFKTPLLLSARPKSQTTDMPSDPVTNSMAIKTESTSSSNEHLPLSSASSEKVPDLPKGLTGAKLVKSTLLSLPPLPPLPPVSPAKKGRKSKKKVEPSATKDAIAKRTKEKINEERKEKLRNLALQKKVDSDQKIKTPSLQVNKGDNKDTTVCSKTTNIAKITERNRGSILLEGFLANPEPRRSARKSKEKIKVNVEISKQPKTEESKQVIAKLKPSLKSSLSLSSSGIVKTVRFSDDNQVVFFECEGNLNKLNASSSKDKNPIIPQHSQAHRNLDKQINEFIFNVVHWNTSWIKESKMVKGDPPICKEVFRAKDTYVSFNDFYRWLGPMILYELWGNVTNSYEEKNIHKSLPRFDGVVLHKAVRNTDQRLVTLKCCVFLMAKDVPSLVDPTDNLLVSASAPTEWTKRLIMFGMVDSQVRVNNIRCVNDPFAIGYLQSSRIKYERCAYFDVVVDNTPLKSIEPGYILMIRPTYNMMNDMRQYECLNRLQTSPLVGLITDPVNNFSFPLPFNLSEAKLISKFPLNEDQTRAVLGATHLALTSKASISLIHGPPGTGKTRVIAAIVEQLSHHYKAKSRSNIILVCTKSNSAIDSICMRLLDVRKQLPREKKFRLTRFGRKERVHDKVLDILTTTLARNEIKKMDLAEQCKLELNLLKAREQALAYKLDASSSFPKEHQDNKRRYEFIQGRISLLEPLANKSASEDAKKKYIDQLVADEELKVINRTDIIATTLGSCTSRRILKALNEPSLQKNNEKRTIGVCIVDEASQATEADILLPLIHGVKHLILVGDQQQLPPFVATETAKNYGFGRSLFTRLHKVWTNIKGAEDQIPIFPLSVQHRMHPEIALFPSATFYEGKLQTPEFLNINMGFKPYAVFTHCHTQDSASETNQKEADLLMKILDVIADNKLFMSLTIGIIVPYQMQKSLVSEMVLNRKYHRKVDVDTIDSYQGQERDVVLMSTVRTSGVGFLSDYQRTNVAITRAKRALYILGNFTSLQTEATWKNLLIDAQKRGVHKELPLNCSKPDIIGFLTQPIKRKRPAK